MTRPEDCRDRGSLARALTAGETAKWVFFWSHREPAGGDVTAACLSQWYPAAFAIDGVRYPTAEHAMMAAKARLFGDASAEAAIQAANSPGAAKALGRGVQDFDQAVWEAARFGIVVEVNRAKFSQNPLLGDFLRGTGRRILVEASPVDAIWGIGLAADHRDARSPARWPGLNLLGFALMEVRAR